MVSSFLFGGSSTPMQAFISSAAFSEHFLLPGRSDKSGLVSSWSSRMLEVALLSDSCLLLLMPDLGVAFGLSLEEVDELDDSGHFKMSSSAGLTAGVRSSNLAKSGLTRRDEERVFRTGFLSSDSEGSAGISIRNCSPSLLSLILLLAT